jgi:transposase
MARPRRIDEDLVRKATDAVASAESVAELRRAQAVLLPAVMGATLEQTAALLGISRASVPRLQARFRENVQAGRSRRRWGGRRRSLMTLDEEKEFLEPWAEQAKAGGILVVSVIRAALAQRLGRSVKPSVAYRLLERHGWRKVAPDTHHPKSDPVAQEEWKKNFPRHWLPCLHPKR